MEVEPSNPNQMIQVNVHTKPEKKERNNKTVKFVLIKENCDVVKLLKTIVRVFPRARLNKTYFLTSKDGFTIKDRYLQVDFDATSNKKMGERIGAMVIDSISSLPHLITEKRIPPDIFSKAGIILQSDAKGDQYYKIMTQESSSLDQYGKKINLDINLCAELLAKATQSREEYPLTKKTFIDRCGFSSITVKEYPQIFEALTKLTKTDLDALSIKDTTKIIPNSFSLLLNEKYAFNRNLGSQLISFLAHLYALGNSDMASYYIGEDFFPTLTSYFEKQKSSNEIQQQVLSLMLSIAKTDTSRVCIELYKTNFIASTRRHLCATAKTPEYCQTVTSLAFILVDNGPFSTLENFDKCIDVFRFLVIGNPHLQVSDIIEFIHQIIKREKNFFCNNARKKLIDEIGRIRVNDPLDEKLINNSLACLKSSNSEIYKQYKENVFSELKRRMPLKPAIARHHLQTIWRFYENGWLENGALYSVVENIISTHRTDLQVSVCKKLSFYLEEKRELILVIKLAILLLRSEDDEVITHATSFILEMLEADSPQIMRADVVNLLILNLKTKYQGQQREIPDKSLLALHEMSKNLPLNVRSKRELRLLVIQLAVLLLESEDDEVITHAASLILEADFPEVMRTDVVYLLIIKLKTKRSEIRDKILLALHKISKNLLHYVQTKRELPLVTDLTVLLLESEDDEVNSLYNFTLIGKVITHGTSLILEILEANSPEVMQIDVVKKLISNLKTKRQKIHIISLLALQKISEKLLLYVQTKRELLLVIELAVLLLESEDDEVNSLYNFTLIGKVITHATSLSLEIVPLILEMVEVSSEVVRKAVIDLLISNLKTKCQKIHDISLLALHKISENLSLQGFYGEKNLPVYLAIKLITCATWITLEILNGHSLEIMPEDGYVGYLSSYGGILNVSRVTSLFSYKKMLENVSIYCKEKEELLSAIKFPFNLLKLEFYHTLRWDWRQSNLREEIIRKDAVDFLFHLKEHEGIRDLSFFSFQEIIIKISCYIKLKIELNRRFPEMYRLFDEYYVSKRLF